MGGDGSWQAPASSLKDCGSGTTGFGVAIFGQATIPQLWPDEKAAVPSVQRSVELSGLTVPRHWVYNPHRCPPRVATQPILRRFSPMLRRFSLLLSLLLILASVLAPSLPAAASGLAAPPTQDSTPLPDGPVVVRGPLRRSGADQPAPGLRSLRVQQHQGTIRAGPL